MIKNQEMMPETSSTWHTEQEVTDKIGRGRGREGGEGRWQLEQRNSEQSRADLRHA